MCGQASEHYSVPVEWLSAVKQADEDGLLALAEHLQLSGGRLSGLRQFPRRHPA